MLAKLTYLFISIGILFLAFENSFYQHINNDGVLVESWLLPLGIIFILIGIFLLILKLVNKLYFDKI